MGERKNGDSSVFTCPEMNLSLEVRPVNILDILSGKQRTQKKSVSVKNKITVIYGSMCFTTCCKIKRNSSLKMTIYL